MTGQGAFRRALLDPAAAVPAGLVGPGGGPAARRFAVYRNNVAVGLTEALEAAFPILRRIVGDDFFRAMAGVFLRAHPPQSPCLADYGAAMPEFLAGFPPVAHLGYLPDVARLENALRRAYHAADAAPLAPGDLPAPADLAAARVTLAPAVCVIRSAAPLFGIWRFNTRADAPMPGTGPEDVLVTRPGFDPHVDLLPPGGAAFVEALDRGATLAAAAAAQGPAQDPAPTIALLLARGAITALHRADGGPALHDSAEARRNP
ncbi:MAG: DNA-binding domain-containing protein [Rhodobacteraceae bacterium]|nr:DNA-binding domain-containing protein [Paracoccaceae bacterium]